MEYKSHYHVYESRTFSKRPTWCKLTITPIRRVLVESHHELIFPPTITRILRYFSVLFPFSDHFLVMCTIDYAIIKCSEAQFRSRQSDSVAHPSHLAPSRSAPSTSTPSSFSSNVALGDIMAQLQRMEARLGTLSTKLY